MNSKLPAKKTLDGEKAFKLHDTYGFPIDLTKRSSVNHLLTSTQTVSTKRWNSRKKRSQAEQDMEDTGWDEATGDIPVEGETEFTGYDTTEDKCRVTALFSGSTASEKASEGDICRIIFEKTPFYAESGGQSSDTGMIYGNDFEAEVTEISKIKGVFVHKAKGNKRRNKDRGYSRM